ncbi:MAG: nucleoside hydrolase [Lentisphaeria bacterium]|nr:nucleoside hydrolase [Lentisphaeria bacterium]
MKKVLLDTDPGSDIDDLVCIAYLLVNPDCEFMGITTVTGEGENRARLASSLCKIAQKDIPIYPGAEEPLFIEQKQKTAPQAAALGNWTHDTDFPKAQALQFMRDTIRANPGEITLLAIGPFTNIALLFTLDPELPSLLEQLIIMGGQFYYPGGEWNAVVDPHATQIVYNRAPEKCISVGLDVTLKVTMDKEEVRAGFDVPLLRPVLDYAGIWFDSHDVITFHDPLTAVSIFNPDVCTYEKGTVTVNLDAGDNLGHTSFADSDNGPHTVAKTVDRDMFFDKYFSVFK